MRPAICTILPLLLVACGTGSGAGQEQQTLDLTLPDADGDGIMDHHEGTEEDDWYDFDGDGTPNWQDTDSDDDGILDSVEAGDDDLITFPVDSDNDGLADFVDLDSDGNCLDDATEGDGDADGDNVLDFTDTDDDNDAILDAIEIGEQCAFPDSDGDGDPDYRDPDSDGDGIADVFEGGTTDFNTEPVDTDGDGTPDYLDLDSDDDGFPDSEERGDNAIFEAPRDTDGDGIGDFADTDSDGDGLSDADEATVHNTDPYSDDSDGDGFTDGSEVSVGTDPLDASSVIEGIYVEVPARTDVEELFQFQLSVEQGDVAFLLDTTCSMGSLVNAMSAEFAQIVSQLSTTIPDAQYGVATFDDYNYGGVLGMGTGQDRPFILQQQVTSDTARVQSVLSGIGLHNGSDLPESAVEAVFQALSGWGYDQNCNGAYENGTDVRPFLSDPTDVFGGTTAGAHDPTWPGGGLNGGMGFRDYALPIVVYATDAPMRDPSTHGTPGGCPGDATQADVTSAAGFHNAKLIGVHVNGNDAQAKMLSLASATGSYADLDGDGATDDPLVFPWSGSSGAFRQTIVDAIDDLVDSVMFSEVTLEVVGDDQGFVIDIDPPVHVLSGAVNGTNIDFTLTFRGTSTPGPEDELHQLTLNVIGDGTVLLDSLDIFVLVPGTTI